MKNLPLGIQTFSKLRNGDYLYVDKTEDIYNLLADGGQYYFLSRPRRFGKSLLISTLKEVFSGNKELFKGLWIYDKITWEKYPVIHMDFLGLENGSEEKLMDSLEYLVNRNAQEYGVTLKEKGFNKRFKELIAQLAKTDSVVILVDEYDKPIIDNLDNIPVAKANRKILKTFYETVKETDRYLKFVFITGVSKFSRVSVFSGLNNLTDITISEDFSTIAGYTQQEMDHYFDPANSQPRASTPVSGQTISWMDALSKKLALDKKVLLEDIKTWYNGYSWDGKNFVYNPYSILTLFKEKRIDNYWFVSGTPTFLLQLIKDRDIDVTRLDGYTTGKGIFDSFDIENMNIYSLLLQTGYLTIKAIVDGEIYLLSYPNQEVKKSFVEHLLAHFSGGFANEVTMVAYNLRKSLRKGDIQQFIKLITSVFPGISYDMFIGDKEAYYQTVIYLVLNLIGIKIQTEVETNKGRIDAVIQTDTAIYVMKFKLGTAETAMKQIKEKKYYQKYLSAGKPVHMVGIGFDPEERNVSDYLMEAVS